MTNDELKYKLERSAFISIDGKMYRMVSCCPEDNEYYYEDEDTSEEYIASLSELGKYKLKFFELKEIT